MFRFFYIVLILPSSLISQNLVVNPNVVVRNPPDFSFYITLNGKLPKYCLDSSELYPWYVYSNSDFYGAPSNSNRSCEFNYFSNGGNAKKNPILQGRLCRELSANDSYPFQCFFYLHKINKRELKKYILMPPNCQFTLIP